MTVRRTVLHVALVALAIPVGLAVGFGARPAWHALTSPHSMSSAPMTLQPAAQFPLARMAATRAVLPQPRLTSNLLIGGVVQASGAHGIALADGARFQVQLRSARSGMVELHSINPEGLHSTQPLWVGWVDAQTVATTPMLRLEGTRGVETLQVVLRGEQQQVVSRESLRILHM